MPSAHVFNNKDGAVYTTSTGAPVLKPYGAERVGKNGPLLIQGTYPFLLYAPVTSPNLQPHLVGD